MQEDDLFGELDSFLAGNSQDIPIMDETEWNELLIENTNEHDIKETAFMALNRARFTFMFAMLILNYCLLLTHIPEDRQKKLRAEIRKRLHDEFANLYRIRMGNI